MPAIQNDDSDNSQKISGIEVLKSEKECSKDATFCHRPLCKTQCVPHRTLSLTILGNYLLSRCHLLDKHELACTIQMCGTLANFTLVCVLVIILPCYMLHIVETSPNLPWYVFQIFQGCLVAAFNFVLLVLVSIFDDNVTLIRVCGNIQIILVGFFVILRYYNYRRGVPLQTYNTDDLSFEYLRQMRSMLKSIK